MGWANGALFLDRVFALRGETLHSFGLLNTECISQIHKYPDRVLRLRTTGALIVDEAMMSDCVFMHAFLRTLREIPLDVDHRRCPDSVGLKQFGYRDIIVCGDIRQLPPASGIAPFWSSWMFQNMFEYFVLREDRRHERDPCMQRLKEYASSA